MTVAGVRELDERLRRVEYALLDALARIPSLVQELALIRQELREAAGDGN